MTVFPHIQIRFGGWSILLLGKTMKWVQKPDWYIFNGMYVLVLEYTNMFANKFLDEITLFHEAECEKK
jgi:hypothetical protein